MKMRPPLHLSVVVIEKGAFWPPSTTVTNFTHSIQPYLFISCQMIPSIAML